MIIQNNNSRGLERAIVRELSKEVENINKHGEMFRKSLVSTALVMKNILAKLEEVEERVVELENKRSACKGSGNE